MEIQKWAELVITFVGGGLFSSVSTYVLAKKKNDLDGFDKILSTWQQDNERLRLQEKANAEALILLQKELANLRAKLSLLESNQVDFPFPMWLKDLDLTMLSVNVHYEREFLSPMNKTATDYIGHTDDKIWPESIANEFKNNDLFVLNSKKVWDGEETIVRYGIPEKYRIIKYIRYAAGVPIGIAGIALPLKCEH